MEEEYVIPNYPSIKIGGNEWTIQNMNTEVPGSFCYGNDPANCERFGRLYTWSAAKSACPNGWLLPSKLDWKQFEISMREKGFSSQEDYWTSTEDETDSSFAYDWFVRTDKAGLYAKNLKEERAYSVRCYRSKNVTLQAGPADLQSTKGKTGDNLKSTYGWNDKNNGNSGNGNNSTKFNALPAGARDSDGEFSELGEYTYFWSSGEIKNKAFRWYLYNESSSFVRGTDNKDMALSVRCIRD